MFLKSNELLIDSLLKVKCSIVFVHTRGEISRASLHVRHHFYNEIRLKNIHRFRPENIHSMAQKSKTGAAVINDFLSEKSFQRVQEEVLRLIDIFDAGYEIPSKANALSSGE